MSTVCVRLPSVDRHANTVDAGQVAAALREAGIPVFANGDNELWAESSFS